MAEGSQDAKFCIFHIRGAVTFTAVPGQSSTTFGGASTIADVSNKDSAWNLGLQTKRSGTVSMEVNVLESTELGLIKTAWESGGVIAGKVLLNETPDFYYTANWVVATFQYDAADGDAVKVSVELQPKTALATTT